MMKPRKRTAPTPRVVPTLTTEEKKALWAAISAPKNAHIFSLEAVSKAFAHVDISEYTDMTDLEREYLTLWIANDLSARLVQEMPEQSEALKALTAEIECACARWLDGGIRSTDMTEPHQRTRALLKTIRFLDELTRPGDTPRVPAHIRDTARQLLLHYPGFEEIEAAHKVLPDVFGPVKQRQAEGMPTPNVTSEGMLCDCQTATPELMRKQTS